MSFPFGWQHFQTDDAEPANGVFAAYLGKIALSGQQVPHRPIFHLDFETWSECELPKTGASVYARHETTEVLMLAYGWSTGEIKQWLPVLGEPMPDDLKAALADPSITLAAWNAPFEMAIFEHTLGMNIPVERWLDVMALSYSLSLPGKLSKCGDVIGLGEDQKKMARGTNLVRKFCMPRKPSKHKPWTRCDHTTDPEDWQEFLDYNIRDVEAERAIYKRLKKYQMPDHEWKLWHLDQKINNAGIPINLKAVKAALKLSEFTITRDMAELRKLTGLANPNSNAQILPWLKAHGYNFDDLKKGHVERAAKAAAQRVEDSKAAVEMYDGPLADYLRMVLVEPDELLSRVLGLRLRVSKASVKKYPALWAATDADWRLRGCHQFAGAGRTWRWSGRRFQPQNLPKPDKALENRIHECIHDIEHLTPEEIWAKYDNPMEVLTAGVRPVVQAPEGTLLLDADLSAIENVVLGWLAQDEKILRVFWENLDPYIDFATDMFKLPYAEIEARVKAGDKSMRTTAKPGVLGCFGADTPVLTDRGWVRIVEVRDTDKLFDGDRWVSHGGVAYQGPKEVVNHHGLTVTLGHRVLAQDGNQEKWIEAKEWVENESSLRAHALANGKFCAAWAAAGQQGLFTGAVAHVASNKTSGQATSSTAKPTAAIAVPRKIVEEKLANGLGLDCTTSSLIVSILREAGARTPTTRTTTITGVGEFVCGSGAPTIGLNTWSMNSEQTDGSKSTAQTTTATTNREIYGSQPGPFKTQISETWDILNTGDRNRFVVLTDAGPLVVHNCGYMLSAGDERENHSTGEIEATGLLGYAWAMHVPLTKEMSKLSVDTFRSKFHRVVEFWYELDDAVRRVIKTGKPETVGYLTIDMKKPFLRIGLPSGRFLHYMRPEIQRRKMPWKGRNGEAIYKPQITYENMETG